MRLKTIFNIVLFPVFVIHVIRTVRKEKKGVIRGYGKSLIKWYSNPWLWIIGGSVYIIQGVIDYRSISKSADAENVEDETGETDNKNNWRNRLCG